MSELCIKMSVNVFTILLLESDTESDKNKKNMLLSGLEESQFDILLWKVTSGHPYRDTSYAHDSDRNTLCEMFS